MQKTILVLQPASLSDVPPPPPAPSNEALLLKLQEGDGEALWLLYGRHADLLRDIIARCLSDEDECEDVLRETFEEIRDRAVHYSPDKGRALGWIMTLARRRALDRARCFPPREKAVSTNQRHVERNLEAEQGGVLSWLRQAVA